MIKKILLTLLAILVIIQFIRPAKNKSEGISDNDIAKHFAVPDDVHVILERACNDCHSNNTVYPWYSHVQPVTWWLQHHIDEGKRELNFSEFAGYTPKRQHHKLEEVIEQVKEDEMPLNSYLWIHKNAKLSAADKQTLSNWAKGLMEEIAEKNNLEDK